MTAPNIERFNILTGAIFALLYEEFPQPFDLQQEHFINEMTLKDESFDGEPLLRLEDEEFLIATIQWLGRHGYLHHGQLYGPPATVSDCVLTAQALSLLNSMPNVLEQKGPSIGEQMISATKEGATGKLKELASGFLEKAVELGIKTASSNWPGL